MSSSATAREVQRAPIGVLAASRSRAPRYLRLLGIGSVCVAGVVLITTLPGFIASGATGITAVVVTSALLAIAARAPIVVAGRQAEVIILLDTTIYLVLADLTPPAVAIPAIAAGMLVATFALPMTTWVRLTHIGAATAIWAIIVGLRSTALGDTTDIGVLAAVALPLAMLGEIGTLAVVSITAWAARGRSPRDVFARGVRTELIAGLGLGALAAFAIVFLRMAPSAAPLLAVPFAMVMIVSAALVRAQKANVRSAGLAEAVVEMQQSTSADEARAIAARFSSAMLRSHAAEVGRRTPLAGELVAQIPHADRSEKIIVLPRLNGAGYSVDDEDALTAVAAGLGGTLRRIELLNALEWRASHDALTGLPNRSLLSEMAMIALEHRRDSDVVGLLFVDLDGFKTMNDHHGHDTGDQILRAIGQRMADGVGSSDVVARLGGDEFCILLRNASNVEDVDRIANEMARVLAMPLQIGGVTVHPRASIGVAVSPQDGTELSVLLRVADERMYGAKKGAPGRPSY